MAVHRGEIGVVVVDPVAKTERTDLARVFRLTLVSGPEPPYVVRGSDLAVGARIDDGEDRLDLGARADPREAKGIVAGIPQRARHEVGPRRQDQLAAEAVHAQPGAGRGGVLGEDADAEELVEEAEANRADVQRIADKFATYYLPVVAGIAAITLIIRQDPMATAAVLVVACSCAFALATPVAMLASIGAGA